MKIAAASAPWPLIPFDTAAARRRQIDAELAEIDAYRERVGRELVASDDRRSALLAERRGLVRKGGAR